MAQRHNKEIKDVNEESEQSRRMQLTGLQGTEYVTATRTGGHEHCSGIPSPNKSQVSDLGGNQDHDLLTVTMPNRLQLVNVAGPAKTLPPSWAPHLTRRKHWSPPLGEPPSFTLTQHFSLPTHVKEVKEANLLCRPQARSLLRYMCQFRSGGGVNQFVFPKWIATWN